MLGNLHISKKSFLVHNHITIAWVKKPTIKKLFKLQRLLQNLQKKSLLQFKKPLKLQK